MPIQCFARRPPASTLRVAIVVLGLVCIVPPVAATVYYVSSETGDDADDGESVEDAFATLDHVNGLALQPGDEVRLLCGETWRADPLIVTRSGSAGNPIVVSSHPADCEDRPILSGAWPVSGWVPAGGNLWVADLDEGANAGRFPNGMRQLFRGEARLGIGRWPNLGAGPNGDGYAVIDAEPADARLQDAGLPAGDWTGARVHAKGIRWYILNRDVVDDLGSILVLNADLSCDYTPSCADWGYFVTSHLLTLDREGEWFWDASTNEVYLFTTTPPVDEELEATAIVDLPGSHDGGIVLGNHLQEEIAWVEIENLRIERWYDAGITFPENLETDENHDLVLRGNEIVDVDGTGIRLATWVWNAGPLSGWRGGVDLLVEDNLVEGANHFGIDGYSVDSTFRGNEIRDIGRIEELSPTGLGCGVTGSNCTENGAGFRLRRSTERNAHDNTIEQNAFERIGMNGLDVFGSTNTIEENVFRDICITKGDCGAVRTFGSGNLATTTVADVVLRSNVILGVEGNTDGCHPDFRHRLGIGLYLDQYSRDLVVEDNTVSGASWVGLLFQNSTGEASGNVLYGSSSGDWGQQWGSQFDLRGVGVTDVELSENRLVSLDTDRYTLTLQSSDASTLVTSSNSNTFWNPFYDTLHIRRGGVAENLAGWQGATGFDAASTEHDYTQGAAEEARTMLLVHDGSSSGTFAVPPGTVDLDGLPVVSPVVLAPWTSMVVVVPPGSIFADGFETGDTSAW